MERLSTGARIATFGIIAVIAAAGTWFVLERDDGGSTAEPDNAALGEPVGSEPEEADEPQSGQDAADATPSWLFSHTADSGTLTPRADGTYDLALNGIDPNVIAFTDRPDRQTSIIEVAHLVEAWPAMFADSPPNAVLVEHDPAGTSDSLVVVLTEPRLEGTTLTYRAAVLDEEDHPDQVTGLVNSAHAEPPASFSTVSMFIDDVNLDASVFECVNGSGQLITPPGTMPIYYKPTAPFVKLCSDVGGTVTQSITLE
jgi:hypothetical protein